MEPPVNSAHLGFPSQLSPKVSRIPWLVVVVSCLYFVWVGFGFTSVLSIFSKLYGSMGVGLPLPTRILLSSRLWLLPLLFTGAAMLTIAIRLVEFSRRQLRIVGVALFLIGAVLPALIVWSLYMPLFALIGKLAGAH